MLWRHRNWYQEQWNFTGTGTDYWNFAVDHSVPSPVYTFMYYGYPYYTFKVWWGRGCSDAHADFPTITILKYMQLDILGHMHQGWIQFHLDTFLPLRQPGKVSQFNFRLHLALLFFLEDAVSILKQSNF